MTSTGRDRIDALVSRGTRFLEVATAAGGLQAMARRRPFSLSAFRLVDGLQAMDLSFRTVLDVGANIGQFTAAAQAAWPSATVIAFEPLANAAAALRARNGVEVHQVAAGDHDGTTVFYPHPYSLSSSSLPVLAGLRAQPWARESAPIDVPMRRLDTLLADRELARPVLLKLDVQGLELSVLSGASDTLRRTDALLLEVAFEASYEGQPLFAEVHQALADAGWSEPRPLDYRRAQGRIMEADLLYRPAVRDSGP